MKRCIQLARNGIGYVSPNPPVGALLLHEDHILGEGFHTCFGAPHAEVEAIRNIPPDKLHLLPLSTLFVSLEPCCTHGKTPPCTDLIIQSGIKRVVIGTPDPNPAVAGKGIAKLREHGIEVITGIIENEAKELILPFRTFVLSNRPFITLKWAQSKWGYTGKENEQIWLSHIDSRTFTHQLRHKHDSILVGARTIMTDNPALTTRYAPGRSPIRIIYDPNGRLNPSFRVFHDDGIQVHYFSEKKPAAGFGSHIQAHLLQSGESHAIQMLSILYRHNIGSVLIEGGSATLQMFIREHLWDKACVIRTKHELEEGINAPIVRGDQEQAIDCGTDQILIMRRSVSA